MLGGKVESQYLVGSTSPLGHSISSHSSGRGVGRLSSRCAGRTRTAAKREASVALLPSRHVTRRQERLGRLIATSLAETDACPSRRRISDGGRPRPLQRFGGSGSVPGGQILVWDWILTA